MFRSCTNLYILVDLASLLPDILHVCGVHQLLQVCVEPHVVVGLVHVAEHPVHGFHGWAVGEVW